MGKKGRPSHADLAKLNKSLKQSLKEAVEEIKNLTETGTVPEGEIALPSGIKTFGDLIEEFDRRNLVIVALEEKLGYAVPAKFEGAALPQVRENILHQSLEKEFNILNRDYTKLYNSKKGEGGTGEVEAPPKIAETPQDHLPIDCNGCGQRVPNRFEGAKQDPADGSWYCVANNCASDRNL